MIIVHNYLSQDFNLAFLFILFCCLTFSYLDELLLLLLDSLIVRQTWIHCLNFWGLPLINSLMRHSSSNWAVFFLTTLIKKFVAFWEYMEIWFGVVSLSLDWSLYLTVSWLTTPVYVHDLDLVFKIHSFLQSWCTSIYLN
jgi:hypothetical protein